MSSNSFSSYKAVIKVGKYDKDRFQKEAAIRLCLARGHAPFLETLVFSASDLSSTVEVVSDLDVLGLEFVADGAFRRTLYDCKTESKLSAINRAFWASGMMRYTGCEEACLILKKPAVHNHRMSALKIGVDLHDLASFEDFAKTYVADFNQDKYYQSSIERWNKVFEAYQKNKWSEGLFSACRNIVPLTREPWTVFRRIVSLLKENHGHFDPAKKDHTGIFIDILASSAILWSLMGRDIRRFYSPTIDKSAFAKTLNYYIWGGEESYANRQHMKTLMGSSKGEALEFPGWDRFVHLAGLVIAAPQEFFSCAHLTREIAFRCLSGEDAILDATLSLDLAKNKRLLQFIPALAQYFQRACQLPRDLNIVVSERLQLKLTPAASP